MAFNFGAFVGGFSEQLVKDLEAEQERKFEMEKIAETEAMRQRAAASSRRRSEQIATEKMMNALSMFYTPENAARIALGGEAVVDQYLSWGATATEKGQDANILLRHSGGSNDVTDQQTQNDMATFAAPSAPEATISTSARTEAPIQTIMGAGVRVNTEAVATLFGEPEDFASNYAALLVEITQRKERLFEKNPNDPQIAELDAQFDRVNADYARVKENEREPNEEVRFYTGTQIETIANSQLRRAYTLNGFQTNVDAEILNNMEGREHIAYLSMIQAAQSIQNIHGDKNDPLVANTVNDMQTAATRGFIDYGNGIRYAGPSARLKEQVDPVTFNTLVGEGRYRVGDVIPVQTADGTTRFVVYTGFPMPTNTDADGRPYDFLFLN